MDNTNYENKIKSMIESSDIVLFMKGSPDFPQCGFSANVVGILNYFNLKFESFNVTSLFNTDNSELIFDPI